MCILTTQNYTIFHKIAVAYNPKAYSLQQALVLLFKYGRAPLIEAGRVLCSYACRPYALWPVFAAIPHDGIWVRFANFA
jgi:hypothetical protein